MLNKIHCSLLLLLAGSSFAQLTIIPIDNSASGTVLYQEAQLRHFRLKNNSANTVDLSKLQWSLPKAMHFLLSK